jgi:hypothetical protein
MSDSTGDIIIKGGSVEIALTNRLFPARAASNKDKKIVSVEVRDNNTSQTQHINIPADGNAR